MKATYMIELEENETEIVKGLTGQEISSVKTEIAIPPEFAELGKLALQAWPLIKAAFVRLEGHTPRMWVNEKEVGGSTEEEEKEKLTYDEQMVVSLLYHQGATEEVEVTRTDFGYQDEERVEATITSLGAKGLLNRSIDVTYWNWVELTPKGRKVAEALEIEKATHDVA